MTMIQLRYRLTFLTPAFLGNADQVGQWRTPAIKALLRQWWRVAYMSHDSRASVTAMRDAEGRLFGHAWLENDRDQQGGKVAARRSQIRLRLDAWAKGKLAAADWTSVPRVKHPEVAYPVPADLYMGYGPVTLPRGQREPTLKAAAAIQAGEAATLSIALPAEEAPLIRQALALMSEFGAAGGRSRNGWGSFHLKPTDVAAPAQAMPALPAMDWRDALAHDWPRAIGADEAGKPLIWQTTEAFADWKLAMRRLAEIKIDLRTHFRFPHERPDGQVHERHWLSYPVTTHRVQAWDRAGLRLPNALRFRLRAEAGGGLRGVVFHMPCMPPPAFGGDRKTVTRVWTQVHQGLASDRRLTRIAA
jgi:CRISPR-associated protein Cmr1